ncbi:LysR family transcriptional regulator [Teredinibacter turnerae]|uniref:LysR family transcriptional regulator n=1 Tax=Teredinibacter turnerae TaxID=2426 RepID=UPI000368D506|nr:LysR family transcriptional regulator [Teredinibacter turnerae]
MDTDSLKSFIAVAQAQSFSLAATQLHLTQPAVSKRIAALEAHLNHTLFDRIGREVRLTEAGRLLLPQAKTILQSVADTERSIRELTGEISGVLRVATSHHIGLHHLPPLLRQFVLLHPEVNLQFEFLDSERAHEKVQRGECEIAVVTLAPEPVAQLESRVIWPDPLDFVIAKTHDLASLDTVDLAKLSRVDAILPDLTTYTGRIVKEYFAQQQLELTLSMTTNYLETVKVMVSVGLGWSLLPRSMIDGNLHSLPVREVSLHRNLGVISHKKRSLSNAARAFYRLLCDKTQKTGAN